MHRVFALTGDGDGSLGALCCVLAVRRGPSEGCCPTDEHIEALVAHDEVPSSWGASSSAHVQYVIEAGAGGVARVPQDDGVAVFTVRLRHLRQHPVHEGATVGRVALGVHVLQPEFLVPLVQVHRGSNQRQRRQQQKHKEQAHGLVSQFFQLALFRILPSLQQD